MAKKFSISSRSVVSDGGIILMDTTLVVNGVTTQKLLSVEDYVDLFRKSETKKVTYQMVPKLREEVFKASISEDGKCCKAVVVLPAMKRGLAIHGKHFYVPYPTLVCFINIKNGVKGACGFFATTDEVVTEASPLYNYPFGNAGTGISSCFGNIKLPKLNGLEDIMVPIQAFLDGETNHDLFSGKISQGELINVLEKSEKFPEELLSKNPNYRTVGDLCKELTKVN